MEKTYEIKGICEECGFAFKGSVKADNDGGLSGIFCPHCHKETYNFDEASAVDELNTANEHEPIEYVESVFEVVKG